MVAHRKTISISVFLIWLTSFLGAAELTLAEQKEKSLEERYRRLLAFSNMGDLQARRDHEEALRKAKLAWDQQRLAIGKPIYQFKEKELEKPAVINDLDGGSRNLRPDNPAFDLGTMVAVELPSEWMLSKIEALNYLMVLPKSKDHHILSPLRKVALDPPKSMVAWKLWQYFEANKSWKLLHSGSGSQQTEILPSLLGVSTYAFFKPLQHPTKLDQIQFINVELDLVPPELISASWSPHFEGGIQLSWHVKDKYLVEDHLIVLIENKKLKRSKILIQQAYQDSIILEAQEARWIEAVSILSYDAVGHKANYHFKIKR